MQRNVWRFFFFFQIEALLSLNLNAWLPPIFGGEGGGGVGGDQEHFLSSAFSA